MSARVVKKNAPQARTVLDVVMPWGEYFAKNPRSIFPMKYVEMCVNGGVEFDASRPGWPSAAAHAMPPGTPQAMPPAQPSR